MCCKVFKRCTWHVGHCGEGSSCSASQRLPQYQQWYEYCFVCGTVHRTVTVMVTTITHHAGAQARLEGVNKPELLPPDYTTVIDVAGFLTPGEVLPQFMAIIVLAVRPESATWPACTGEPHQVRGGKPGEGHRREAAGAGPELPLNTRYAGGN